MRASLFILACFAMMVVGLPATSTSHLVRREETAPSDAGFTNNGRKEEEEDEDVFNTPPPKPVTKAPAPTAPKGTVTKNAAK